MPIAVKRIYDEPSAKDGYRILVDRVWPRGVTKERAHLDEWNKDIAPSAELRKWFNHKKERFEEFGTRYRHELQNRKDEIQRIRKIADGKQVTLVYSAKSTTDNQAVVLCEVLNDQRP